MKSRLAGSLHRALPLAAALLLLGAATAPAAEFWLRAEAFDLAMPDGRAVRMWGYAECTSGFASCAAPTVPGPRLTVPVGETLAVNLRNNGLPEPVSITIPGQREDAAGEVVRNLDGRIRAFTHEVASGATGVYTWSTVRPGTYLYQSGSHIAVQLQMGLYGAMTHDVGDAPKNAYDALEAAHDYDQDLVLLLSEVAPDLHDAVRDGTYGADAPNPPATMTSTVKYEPKYFLVNGAPWAPGSTPLPVGAPATTTLLRFLNAGLLSHYPSISWGYLTLLAEDGFPLQFPHQSYHVDLHAGKTADVTFTVPAAGAYAVFDRSGALASAGQPEGGMMAVLGVPSATSWGLTVLRSGTGAGQVVTASSPGGIGCGTDCAETYNDGTEVRLEAEPAPGSAFVGWTGPAGCSGAGDCVVTMDADQTVTATFAAVGRVRVITPNGGESIPEGSFFTIRWGAAAAALHYTVQFSRDGGRRWRTIRRGVIGDTLVWQVPLFWQAPLWRKTQRRCKIRVIAFRNNGSRLGFDVSDRRFRIINNP